MVQRYVFDGAPGSGKTSLLLGTDQEETVHSNYIPFGKKEYNIVLNNIGQVFDEMRSENKNPKDFSNEAIVRILKVAKNNFKMASLDSINLFDRGIPGYIIFESRLKGKMPIEFSDLCANLRYSSPIFIFEPIPNYDTSIIRKKKKTNKLFTLKERYKMNKELKAEYKKWGYEVIEVPIFSENKEKSLEERARMIENILRNLR